MKKQILLIFIFVVNSYLYADAGESVSNSGILSSITFSSIGEGISDVGILSSIFSDVGEGVSKLGIICSEKSVKIVPIAKYKFNQDGTRGVVFGAQLVSLAGPWSGDLIIDLLDYLSEELIQWDIELWLNLILEKKPENIIVGFKINDNDNKKVDNSDVVYLAEYDGNLKVGKPIEVYAYPSSYNGDPELIPPTVGNILYTKDIEINGIGDYLTVAEAHHKMQPQIHWLNKNLYFHTVGVVTGYTISENKLFMILKEFGLMPYPISGMTNQMNASFIPVNVSNRTDLPEIGSVVKVGGFSERQSRVIKQSYEWWYDLKCIYALAPSEFEILNGKYVKTVPIGTSLFFSHLTQSGGQAIGFNWSDENIVYPDFTINSINVNPDVMLEIGKTYTVSAKVYNNGNKAGNCVVKFYNSILDKNYIIGEAFIENLQPANFTDVEIQWSINQFSKIPFLPLYIYAVAENPSHIEYYQSNNIVYIERYLKYQNTHTEISAYCPVTLKITSDNGNIIDPYTNEIEGALYQVDDYNNDANLDHRVYIPNDYSIKYEINVLPDSLAKEDDTFTLTIRNENELIVLMDSVLISDISSDPIVVDVREIKDTQKMPTFFSLQQNYPNPFNPSTKIQFNLPKACMVKINVLNILGEEISVLLNEYRNAGNYEVIFSTNHLSSGVYFYKMQAGDYIEIKKMQILK